MPLKPISCIEDYNCDKYILIRNITAILTYVYIRVKKKHTHTLYRKYVTLPAKCAALIFLKTWSLLLGKVVPVHVTKWTSHSGRFFAGKECQSPLNGMVSGSHWQSKRFGEDKTSITPAEIRTPDRWSQRLVTITITLFRFLVRYFSTQPMT